MSTFQDVANTAIGLVAGAEPQLLAIVGRSLAVSSTACAIGCSLGCVLGAWLLA